MAEWHIEPLAGDHDRGAFECGNPDLDAFIRTLAGQYARKDVGRTFVAARSGSRAVIGYYTLAASALEYARLPPGLVKRLPRHAVPAVLLGRLAADRTARGIGLGGDLLADAVRRAIRIADEVGVFAVHAHAIDADAAAFYARFGFERLPAQHLHLLLPLSSVRKGLG